MGREPGTFGYVHDDILYVWCMSLCIVSGNQIIVHAVCPNHAGDSSYVGCYPTLSVTGLANIKKKGEIASFICPCHLHMTCSVCWTSMQHACNQA